MNDDNEPQLPEAQREDDEGEDRWEWREEFDVPPPEPPAPDAPPPRPYDHQDDVPASIRQRLRQRPSDEEEDEERRKRLRAEPSGDELEGLVVEILLDFFAEPGLTADSNSYVTQVFSAERYGSRKQLKKRVEVSLRELSRDDRAAFDAAKAKEWQSWLDKEAVEIVKNRLNIPRTHILRSRWVLTWKVVGEGKQAKARLCVLGFQDPRLTTLETSSPTLTADGEQLIVQWVVSHGYLLESGDLKTAFLSGDVDPGRRGKDAIYVDLPQDIKGWLRLGPDEAIRLRKAVYGLINAPLQWHKRLSRALRQAGFIPMLMDECIWILADDVPQPKVDNKEIPEKLKEAMMEKNDDDDEVVIPPTAWTAQRVVHGVLGIHVDDLIGGGNHKFQKAVA